MTHPVMRHVVATVGAMSLLAAFTVATAQPPEVTIYPVSFPSGSIVLHTADYETIHGIAAMMARDPALVATVLGKADTMGAASYNERLSQRRAEAVSAALVRIYKVPADRVEVRWAGESQPVVLTADQTAELQNRVAEIIVHYCKRAYRSGK